jgi:hypothetical protein
MSSTTTQIISFATKEAVTFQNLAGAAKVDTKGLQNQVLGVGIEEPEAKHWFLGWHSQTSLLCSMNADSKARTPPTEWDAETKCGMPDFEKILSPLTSEHIQNIHVAFNKPPMPCLTAPVTRIILSTTKPEQDLITFGEICNVRLRATAEQPGCLGTSWGYTIENPRAVVLLVGWETVDVSHLCPVVFKPPLIVSFLAGP